MKSYLATIALIFLSTSLVTSCDTSQPTSETKVTEGINLEKNPIQAVQQIAKSTEKLGQIQEELAEKKPVEPVSFNDLISLLPKTSSGWIAEDAEGETNSYGGFKISQASRSYNSEDRQIEISITDWAFNTQLYGFFLMSSDFSQESTEGYNKGIKIGDIPGREEYQFASKDGTLSLLVEERFFIEIDGSNIDSQELQQWWQKMDQKAIAKLAQ